MHEERLFLYNEPRQQRHGREKSCLTRTRTKMRRAPLMSSSPCQQKEAYLIIICAHTGALLRGASQKTAPLRPLRVTQTGSVVKKSPIRPERNRVAPETINLFKESAPSISLAA